MPLSWGFMSVCVTQELSCTPPLRNSPVLEPACGQRSLFLPAQASPWGGAVFLPVGVILVVLGESVCSGYFYSAEDRNPVGIALRFLAGSPTCLGLGLLRFQGLTAGSFPTQGTGRVRDLDCTEGTEPLNEGFRPGTLAWDPSDSKNISFVRIFFGWVMVVVLFTFVLEPHPSVLRDHSWQGPVAHSWA